MLPGSRGVYRWTMSMVTFPARKGDDHAAADPAGDTGPGRPGRAGTPLPHHPRRRDPYPLPDGAAVRPGPHPTPDRAAGAMQPRYRAPGAQALPGRWARRRAAPAAPGAATPLPAWVGAGTGPGRRLGSPRGWGRQCAVDLPAFGRLPSRGDRPPGGDRDGQDRAAPGPDAGLVAGWQVGPAAGPGARHQLQAVRLWAGRLARRAPGLGGGRRAPRRAAVRPAAPRGGPLPLAWQDRHGDLGLIPTSG